MNRIRDRRKDGDTEHQRGLTDRLGSPDRVLAIAVLEQCDAEVLWKIEGSWNLVRGRRVRSEAPVLVEHEFLACEPTGALHEPALDLAEIDGGVERAAAVM